MRIIGVIDLKHGQAVHARGGRRETYAAVRQAAGVAINGVARDLARVYVETLGLTELYVADLNAIAAAAPHDDTIRRIGAVGAALMVDAGVATPEDARRTASAGAHTVIVGLETLRSFDELADICRDGCRVAFSLDLRNGVPLQSDAAGPAASPEAIAERAVAAGADAVIVLDVARVGTEAGPDMQMLKRIRGVTPGSSVLAGGGVRGLDDLRQLAEIGCDGALVASALHDGRLTAADVAVARGF